MGWFSNKRQVKIADLPTQLADLAQRGLTEDTVRAPIADRESLYAAIARLPDFRREFWRGEVVAIHFAAQRLALNGLIAPGQIDAVVASGILMFFQPRPTRGGTMIPMYSADQERVITEIAARRIPMYCTCIAEMQQGKMASALKITDDPFGSMHIVGLLTELATSYRTTFDNVVFK